MPCLQIDAANLASRAFEHARDPLFLLTGALDYGVATKWCGLVSGWVGCEEAFFLKDRVDDFGIETGRVLSWFFAADFNRFFSLSGSAWYSCHLSLRVAFWFGDVRLKDLYFSRARLRSSGVSSTHSFIWFWVRTFSSFSIDGYLLAMASHFFRL